MPLRPYWKGYLKLSLVTCPVQMMPATSESLGTNVRNASYLRGGSKNVPWGRGDVQARIIVVSLHPLR